MKAFGRKIYITGSRQSSLEQAKGRLLLLGVFFVFFYIIVAARAADVSIIQGEFNRSERVSFHRELNEVKQDIVRSDIVDRNGVILARSLKTSSLYADPKMIDDPVGVSKDLVKLFPEVSYGSLLQKLQSKKRFVWVKRNIDPQDQAKILYLGHPGLSFKNEMNRVYPQGALAAHLVGVSGVDSQGLNGLEASFDDYLGEKQIPLALTLDVRLQHILKREIASTIKRHKAKAGVGVIMDVSNGEILGAVSLPDFDPYEYQNANDLQKFNQITLGVYELGSVFKIFSTAALLEKSNAKISKKFDVREPIKVGRFQIKDYHPENRLLSLPEVFIHSSNIGSAMMGQHVGTKKLKSFYKDLGLLNKPDFEILELGRPIVPNPWREVHTLTASYGHGIAVSPLQLMSATASIVNGGTLVKPTIISSNNSHQNAFQKSKLRIVSPQTSHRLRQLMRLVVTEGTGSKADVSGFLVGGKTGTAEKPSKGGYNETKLLSSFLGVFPMNEPKYAVYVMIDEPQGIKETYGYATGGWVGAPTVGRIISGMVSVLGLKPVNKKDQNFEKSLMRFVKTKEQIKREKEIASH